VNERFGDPGVDHDRPLRRFWEQSRGGVGAELAVIERAVAAAVAGELGDEQRALAAREAHKLVGSAATVGFAAASERARELEIGLSAGALAPADAALLEAAVRDCRNELFGTVSGANAALEPEPDAAGSPMPGVAAQDGSVDLLLVADDGLRARQIIAEAQRRGLASVLAADVASARRALRLPAPRIVLLDLALSEGVEASLGLLDDAASEGPVLVITDPGRTVDRVEIARRGGRGFLPHALSVGEAVQAVLNLRQRMHPAGIRVLAVDPDPAAFDPLEACLRGAGFDVRICRDPAQVWTMLDEHQSDLLILDYELPGLTGPQLCRALRNDPSWEGLPVVFLAATSRPESIREMFEAGADDYVRKPLVGSELLARIFNRLERVALHRSLADLDPLTGALNRRKSLQDIKRLLRMAARAHEPVSLSVIDLDNFMAINNAHGHPTGDAVLREIAGALRRYLRGDDVVARWGGDEFVIAMYGMARQDGQRRVSELLELVAGGRFGDGNAIRVTLSGGLAEYPTDAAELLLLHDAATGAMQRAKRLGGGRVELTSTASLLLDA
jgi:diguanylate cyclase (GGDEF)-like protein